MTIDDLIERSNYELFTKVCSGSHSLYHLLLPYRTSDLRLRGHPFQLPDYYTDLMFSLFSCYCIDVCMMCVLSHLNKDYLLTYLLTYLNQNMIWFCRSLVAIESPYVVGGASHITCPRTPHLYNFLLVICNLSSISHCFRDIVSRCRKSPNLRSRRRPSNFVIKLVRQRTNALGYILVIPHDPIFDRFVTIHSLTRVTDDRQTIYYGSENCNVRLKTVEQLWNAETICFRVLF